MTPAPTAAAYWIASAPTPPVAPLISTVRTARGTAGFTWVTSHVFRKTCATILDEAGLSARAVADQLGHARPLPTPVDASLDGFG